MLFGWFYTPVVIMLHFVAWWAWTWFERIRYGRLYFAIIGFAVGACLFSAIGVKEKGSETKFTLAYALSAGIAAFLSCMVIGRKGLQTREQTT